ncbi:hypothetical protein SLEP1_g24517 [Rubroshorea leprosula]|uniref:Uncharacterized protein n=1 Tax=Rubroshorea leprosula TaxID=152421 RepID=A0AAV5JPQ0_9ROSI|nr:hypothetical protein SLEP1_g24517 [Rubroshorea leprosula]
MKVGQGILVGFVQYLFPLEKEIAVEKKQIFNINDANNKDSVFQCTFLTLEDHVAEDPLLKSPNLFRESINSSAFCLLDSEMQLKSKHPRSMDLTIYMTLRGT